MPDFVILAFVFAFGACVGSFLNVVVYRLPRGQSLSSPPSRCPKCEHKLAWHDNVPVLGWMWLRGRCRYCHEPISARYPIIEFLTGALFVFYYVAMFDLQWGPCPPPVRAMDIRQDWPIYALYMVMLATLLAASLIDAELYIIPLGMCWLLAGLGAGVHAVADSPMLRGNLLIDSPAINALAAGGTVGWLLSVVLMYGGVVRRSFPQGEPLLSVDRDAIEAEWAEAQRKGENPPPLPPPYSVMQIYAEMAREVLFMLPAVVLGAVCALLVTRAPAVEAWWKSILAIGFVKGLLGAMLGALVGGLVVWMTRILGTLFFRKVAMGLGDVHLMFGVGAIIGGGPVTVAFFIAPFAGMAIALYLLATGKKREIPYGPYLSIGTAVTLLLYCPIAAWLAPGLVGLGQMIQTWASG